MAALARRVWAQADRVPAALRWLAVAALGGHDLRAVRPARPRHQRRPGCGPAAAPCGARRGVCRAHRAARLGPGRTTDPVTTGHRGRGSPRVPLWHHGRVAPDLRAQPHPAGPWTWCGTASASSSVAWCSCWSGGQRAPVRRILTEALGGLHQPAGPGSGHSTVTDLARLRGWSTSVPRATAMW